jgi:hypothetical protein
MNATPGRSLRIPSTLQLNIAQKGRCADRPDHRFGEG